MVSIRESVEALDRSHKLRELTLECYISAIQSVAQYAVELEDKITGPFRRHVEAVAAEAACGGAESLRESRSTLRGLLREYRDKASEYINGIREQFANSARAFEEIMDTMAHADGDSDAHMRVALGRLRDIAAKPECAPAQTAILASAHALESGIDQMRKQHQFTISQFQAEIHVLHQRIQAMEAAAMVDELSKFLVREEMEERIRDAGPAPYSLLLIRVSGLCSAERQHGSGVAAELTGAFGKRLRAGLSGDAAIGRWSEERFIAKTGFSRQEAFTCARRLSECLSGSYSCMKDGKPVRTALQASVAVVDREVEEPPTRTLVRVNEFFRI
jgi:GGDEF domain-containing protein